MATPDAKADLKHYLQAIRQALLWKCEGLSERALRLPHTQTGTNLLGLVKHAANVEIGYFGDCFGREWPTDERVDEATFDADPNADFYATADESAEQIFDFYRRVWAFADETIDGRSLDSPGRVPWWPDEHADVTLALVIVHVITDLARHAGHADILREQIDGAAGVSAANSNLPAIDWPAYVEKLNALAQAADAAGA